MKKKIILSLIALVTAVAGVAAFSAYEAHVINVTAHIENALSVTPKEIMFGTVFPQEKLYEYLTIEMSDSFFYEDRVDDIEYVIKQKPKPLVPENATWCHENFPGFEFYPRNWEAYLELCYIPLCPYLSKMPDNDPDNDQGLRPFHQMSAMAYGRLAKTEQDTVDIWTIDLDVPCFEGQCAQDWTHQGWELPGELESKVFGCDLWIEITGISETSHSSECEPGIVYPCNTNLPGICAQGTKTCDSLGYWGECIGPEPNTEVCDDGLDNDCDGLTDYDDVADCTYPEPEIEGCMDVEALNYNSEATIDDESCTYPEPEIQGCTDSEALNYDPEATIDDQSCTYPEPEIEGCTDSEALNYDPEATIDDESCTYPEPISTDTGWKSPLATGGKYNDWAFPAQAYSSDNNSAASPDEIDTYYQSYENFDLGVPAGATIDGIEVSAEGYEGGSPGDVDTYLNVYNNSSTSWATESSEVEWTGEDTTVTKGGVTSLWGKTWVVSDFSDANFSAYIKTVINTQNEKDRLDHIQIKVHYTE